MSKVYTDTVTSTEASQDLTLGGSGDNVIVTAGATLKTNTVKDSGGNTIWTSDGSGNLSSINAAMKGNMVLLTTNTFTNAASSSFTSGIDSTYKLYIFKFYDVGPATDGAIFQFQVNASGQTGYNETITSTFFHAHHKESASDATLQYRTDADLAQGTSYQYLVSDSGVGSDADQSCTGELFIFNPASTTYVKHFSARTHNYMPHPSNVGQDWATDAYIGGYINTTTAIDDIQFKMSSGNMDGVIKMYGLG